MRCELSVFHESERGIPDWRVEEGSLLLVQANYPWERAVVYRDKINIGHKLKDDPGVRERCPHLFSKGQAEG